MNDGQVVSTVVFSCPGSEQWHRHQFYQETSDAVNGWMSRVIKLIHEDKTAFTKPHAKV